MDDLERLAARMNLEFREATAALTRELLGSASLACSTDRQFQALQRAVTNHVMASMMRLNAGTWAWAESLRRYNGQDPSSFVDESLPIPEWDADWHPREGTRE